mmetsp:Transcript_19925/g.24613  ORF Transcript_19925/g.24613 Transcript_19925/m.24613 type:complete len:242 (+) Transcript_19925:400-1125(+)|eukprot:CAMPEP_0172490666 /NCGR_PEP_ID=MMETSP1066-20121228/21181_1 /TAXON_ID=671091 /ORGANISM="Coscinodiscus wailesii, Strain CCMP2513" /LENGTH=241 /DNA_ID=CAMNT_0013259259 /DNA_START=397 /DNA_END=1122 /DNA_ORIENTATION=+
MDVGGAGMGAAAAGGEGFDFMSWYMNIPVISRIYFTSAFLTTAACAVDIISPFSLYFNFNLIFVQGQVWRLLTTFLFFGLFSIDFLFHMYFLVRYCRLLEEGDFRGRTAHFAMLLLFGIVMMTAVAPFVSVHFLGSSLTFMLVYVWGRRNEDMRMSFLGVFSFNAPYLPWVMLTFSVLLGNPVTIDVIGIIVGHTYFFLEYVYPVIADIRGWRMKRILEPPRILHWICGTYQEPLVHEHQD